MDYKGIERNLNPIFVEKLKTQASRAIIEEYICNVGEEGFPDDVWLFLQQRGEAPMYEMDEAVPLLNFREWTASELLEAMEAAKIRLRLSCLLWKTAARRRQRLCGAFEALRKEV